MRLLPALVLGFVSLVAGCRMPVAPTDPPTDSLAQAEARWRVSGISAYEMTYRVVCFCTPETTGPWTVRVEEGRVTRMSGPAPGTQPPGGAKTVATLFKEIREAQRAGADSVAVTYDLRDGHPVTVRIDRSFQMADEEVGYEISAFTRLR